MAVPLVESKMLEKIIRSVKKGIFTAGFYAIAIGCGSDTFGESIKPDAGSAIHTDAQNSGDQVLCTDKDKDTFYAGPDCNALVDCDDKNNSIFPGAIEFCDHLDNNCDGQIDENAGRTVYRDVDQDGFGDKNTTVISCLNYSDNPKGILEGYIYNPDDCNDNNQTIHPKALELCDTIDQDCDGNNDNGFPVGDECDNGLLGECIRSGSYVCSLDALSVLCDAPVGMPLEESCDGVDNDCDGLIDNGLIAPSRDCSAGVGECIRSGLEYKICERTLGWSPDYSGCDAVVGIPAAELCDNLDNDCDGELDNFTRLVDCPTPIRSSYTQECIGGEWFDVDLDDCPECLEGTERYDSCCGYDGEGTRTEICVEERWVDSGICSIDNWINVSNDPARDLQPNINGDSLVFTSDRGISGRKHVYFADTSNGIIEIVSDPLDDPSGVGCGFEWGACNWLDPYCENGSISGDKIALECAWLENDPVDDDLISNFIYVLDTSSSSIIDLRSDFGIAGHTPFIREERVVFQKIAGASRTIEVRNATTGDFVQNFGEGEEFPTMDGDYVAFTSQRDGDQRVYLGNITDGTVTLISGLGYGENGYRPTIHGNDVVFVSDRDGPRQLYHYDIEASELERLTDCGPNYEPSIYNRRVAFTSERTGGKEIYVCDLAETMDCCTDAILNISNDPLHADYNPSISDCKVAYVKDVTATDSEIYVYDVCEGGCRE